MNFKNILETGFSPCSLVLLVRTACLMLLMIYALLVNRAIENLCLEAFEKDTDTARRQRRTGCVLKKSVRELKGAV